MSAYEQIGLLSSVVTEEDLTKSVVRGFDYGRGQLIFSSSPVQLSPRACKHLSGLRCTGIACSVCELQNGHIAHCTATTFGQFYTSVCFPNCILDSCVIRYLETILRPVLKNKKTVHVPEGKHFKESQVWKCGTIYCTVQCQRLPVFRTVWEKSGIGKAKDYR